MEAFAWTLGVILAAVFGFAGVAKMLDLDRMRDRFGYTKRQYQAVGLCELAAAAGVIVGLVWKNLEWIGLAAAVGLCCLMLGALMAHARVADEGKRILPAVAMLVIAIAYMIGVSLR